METGSLPFPAGLGEVRPLWALAVGPTGSWGGMGRGPADVGERSRPQGKALKRSAACGVCLDAHAYASLSPEPMEACILNGTIIEVSCCLLLQGELRARVGVL